MRRALQYSAVTGPPTRAAQRGADALTRRQMHEGAVSAELGLAGWPSVAESLMVERDLALAAYEDRRASHAPLGAGVRRRGPAGRAPGSASAPRRARITSALTDERALPRCQPEDEPAPPHRGDGARSSTPARRHDHCIATDHAPHARQEKDVPFEEAPFGVTGLETAFARSTRPRRPREAPARDAARADVRRARAGVRVARAADRGRWRANLVVLDLEAEWTVTEDGFRSRSATRGSSASGSRVGREDGRRRSGVFAA